MARLYIMTGGAVLAIAAAALGTQAAACTGGIGCGVPEASSRVAQAACTGGISCGVPLLASSAGSGLGSSKPAARDVSLSPYWHVYTFNRGGVSYVQVNDQAGSVHTAFGVANGHVLALPIGADQVRTVADATVGQVVYKSAVVTVAFSVGSDGSVTWLVEPTGL